jgi:hypothetical protein
MLCGFVVNDSSNIRRVITNAKLFGEKDAKKYSQLL